MSGLDVESLPTREQVPSLRWVSVDARCKCAPALRERFGPGVASGFWRRPRRTSSPPRRRSPPRPRAARRWGGSTAAGLFGLAGAAGAVAAPLAGAIADARGPKAVIKLGSALVIASFAAMALWPASLAVLIVGTVTFDLGVQASLVSHQTIVYSLDPAARSRLNAVLVSSMFLGMSAGAALASQVLPRHGWSGVMTLGAAAATLALVVRSLPERPPR